jgi:hypothetical protein
MGKYRGDIVEFAKKAMEYPTEFGERNYASFDDREFYSHAPVGIGQHRDSELLDRCNWQAALNYLNENYPDNENEDWYIHSAGHWAVGWVEKIMVRVFKNPDADDKFTEDNITEMYDDLVDFVSGVQEYPILDESLYSEMEYREVLDSIDQNYPSWAASPDADIIYSWLMNENFYAEEQYYNDDEVALACFVLEMFDPDERDEANAWAEKVIASVEPERRYYYDRNVRAYLENFKQWCDSIVA